MFKILLDEEQLLESDDPTTPIKKYIIYLDCSGSIQDHFHQSILPMAKRMARDLITSERTYVSVCTYDHLKRDQIPFTNDADELCRMIDQLVCHCGGTYLRKLGMNAIQQFGGSLQGLESDSQEEVVTSDDNNLQEENLPKADENAQFVSSCASFIPQTSSHIQEELSCIFFTDGATQHPERVLPVFNRLKEMGVKIFMIGVGNEVTMDSLIKYASSEQHAVLVESFSTLRERISSTLHTALSPAVSGRLCVSTEWTYDAMYDIKSPSITLYVYVGNTGTTPITGKEIRIVISKKSLFSTITAKQALDKSQLQPGDEIRVPVTLSAQSDLSIHQLSLRPYLDFKVEVDNKIVDCESSRVYFDAQMFFSYVAEWTSEKYKNVDALIAAMIGVAGSGKSSLLNSIIRALSGNERRTLTDTGVGGATRSREKQTYTILRILQKLLKTRLKLVDVWGKELVGDNPESLKFTITTLEKMINGYLHDGFTAEGGDLDDKLSQCKVKRREWEVDCVVVVVDPQTMNPESQAVMSKFRAAATKTNRQYVFVVTHADGAFESAQDCFDEENEVRKAILDRLQFAQGDTSIVFISNEHTNFPGDERVNRFCRDMSVFQLFEKILKNYDSTRWNRGNSKSAKEGCWPVTSETATQSEIGANSLCTDPYPDSNSSIVQSTPSSRDVCFQFEGEGSCIKQMMTVHRDWEDRNLIQAIGLQGSTLSGEIEKCMQGERRVARVVFKDEEDNLVLRAKEMVSVEKYGTVKRPVKIELLR